MSWKVNFTPNPKDQNTGVATATYKDDDTLEEFSAGFTIKYPGDASDFLSQVKPWIVDLMDKKKAAEIINADLAQRLRDAFGENL